VKYFNEVIVVPKFFQHLFHFRDVTLFQFSTMATGNGFDPGGIKDLGMAITFS
jgi:hypothetical protein